MNTEVIRGNFTALSPLHHGGAEQNGTEKIILKIPTIITNAEGDETWDNIPCIHGNAIRGYLRRLIMQDLLDLLDYKLDSKKLYHFLFTGGALEAVSSKDAGTINLPLKKRIREALPPVSLMGSALGNQMFNGKLKVMIADLICKETAQFYDDDHNNFSSYNLTDTDFGTRLDDLQERGEDEAATQMKYEFGIIIRGARFTHEFILEDTNLVERACFIRMFRLWEERPFLGGKSGVGYGKVKLDYPSLVNESDSDYLTFINENKKDIISLLDELSEKWK
jgi:CRISPR/Cas system CSM-associated protein Csm3 (group 7 of RAMP superfamily)